MVKSWFKRGKQKKGTHANGCLFLSERLISVHAAGNAQAGQNSRQNSYYRLNNIFPSIFFHFCNSLLFTVYCLLLFYITPQVPLSSERLGPLEEPLNVAPAPQRGVNPHSRRGSGLGVRLLSLVAVTVTAVAAVAVPAGVTAASVDVVVIVVVLVVLHDTLVGTGYALHLLTVAVVAGNLDGSVSQFILQVSRGGEDDAAAADKASLHLVHVGNTLGAKTESHAAQSVATL